MGTYNVTYKTTFTDICFASINIKIIEAKFASVIMASQNKIPNT